jgi:hypothetical protein
MFLETDIQAIHADWLMKGSVAERLTEEMPAALRHRLPAW